MKTADGGTFPFNVDQMSDGTLRVLGLLVALYQQPAPATIALEEPEQTVHPGVLRVLAEAIEEVSDTRQILVTTHSPDLLDRFDPAQMSKRVIAVEMENGVTTAKPLNAAQIEAVRSNLFTLGQLMSIEGLHG
ncbi:MAG: ATP-binding protein [Alphaproteobacteria bacterium]|nr:ATP-binding protein [Alphaproteobacteria bacterium]